MSKQQKHHGGGTFKIYQEDEGVRPLRQKRVSFGGENRKGEQYLILLVTLPYRRYRPLCSFGRNYERDDTTPYTFEQNATSCFEESRSRRQEARCTESRGCFGSRSYSPTVNRGSLRDAEGRLCVALQCSKVGTVFCFFF